MPMMNCRVYSGDWPSLSSGSSVGSPVRTDSGSLPKVWFQLPIRLTQPAIDSGRSRTR